MEASIELERPFTEEEILLALKEINPGKAPGPDGFNARYLLFLWDSIKASILSFCQGFFSHAFIPRGINASFLALIPKIDHPTIPSDFRPISLINCTMKIILKLLANRFKPILPSIISDTQSAFIKGRQIADSILMTNEVVHSIQKGFSRGIVLKLDFEKAFDTVEWCFLLDALSSFGFGARRISWIKSILSSSRSLVLVNGSPSREFSMK